MKRSNRRKPKARQTTLTQFPVLSTAGSSGLRRSTRGATTVAAPEGPSPPPPQQPLPLPPKLPTRASAKKVKQKQLKLNVEKKPRLTHNAPVLSPPQPPKSLDFAVVIITPPKNLLPQQALEPIGFPHNQSQDQDIKPPLQNKGKGEGIASQGIGTSDSEDGDPISSSTRKRKADTKVATTDKAARDCSDEASTSSSRRSSRPTHISLDSSDEDIGIAPSSSPKRSLWVAIPPKKDDVPAPKRIRQTKNDKKPAQGQTGDSGEDDSDDDDAPITPARRKGKSKQAEKLPVDGLEDEEKEDLEEDLAFMIPKHNILSSRTRYNGSSPRKTPYQRKLDELRAKRAGKEIQQPTSDDGRPKRALYDTDPEDDSHDGEDGDDNQNLTGDSDNESWIIEDDGTLGAPDPDAQIPIEFTSLSHQSTRTNFKVVCLWVVQSILNPSFPLDDKISVFALRALERRIDSYGGSVLQSSAWKAPFMRAMKARPCFDSEPCDERQTCDACHISGRTATYAVTITGNRYDPSTLEDLEGSDDDSEDSAGLEIPGEETTFYLGRHCHARAQMSHAFIHWKKQLRDAIETILEQQGYFSPYWASKAAKMDVEERTRWANSVTENLGDHIKEFYHDLKRGLEDAQTNMTTQRFKKWR